LGCGDIRNIPFTIYSQGPLSIDATIKITAGDFDSAILARNIFLSSLIVKRQARLEQATTSE